ncbi:MULTISPECIES: anaerobic ribonucleoside-triphosphate reductase activating protein [Clostridium]|uniref:anaerobic ribonucleoside-triphosphate reductase activating protein n=1 Tax=Clostridium TaxID=1485 RepID=UPI0008263C67|nr:MULTISPECIES: anaerobic ribonucleoside-triphosphate reductase activating protein [Clostridium]PJI07864.1 anaerobic ribonucleoside-triphosphate reductase activating protein [Clostridium sp. CT7]
MNLRVAGFLDNSMVNGEGMRSVLFLSGCRRRCPGCQNEAMQDFKYGEDISVMEVLERIKDNMPIIKGVTFSGGDPLEQAENLIELSKEIKKLGLNIWSYTGYTHEQILEESDPNKLELLKYIDVLVDGEFKQDLMENAPKYAGSSNQRVIRLK